MARTDRFSFAAITWGRVFASAILRTRASSCGVHRCPCNYYFPFAFNPNRLGGGWPFSFQLNPQTLSLSLDRLNRGSEDRGSFLQRGRGRRHLN